MNHIIDNNTMNQLNLDDTKEELPITTFADEIFDSTADGDVSVVSISPMSSPVPVDEPRRVSFAPTIRVYPSELSYIDESWWYSRDELMHFRESARRMASYFWSFTAGRHENRPMLALGAETRGLEGKFCYERQRRKYWAKRYIVGASQRKWPAERIAEAAIQLDKWAADLALEEGKRDYERAYENKDGPKENLTPSKRCYPGEEGNGRVVRQKVR